MSILSVWTVGFDIKFSITRRFLAHSVGLNGARTFWRTYGFRLRNIEISRFKNELRYRRLSV